MARKGNGERGEGHTESARSRKAGGLCFLSSVGEILSVDTVFSIAVFILRRDRERDEGQKTKRVNK